VPFTDGGKVRADKLLQHRLVVEEVDVREAARLEEAEHALGLGREMGEPCHPAFAGALGGGEEFGEEHRTKGQPADAAGRAA